MPTTINGVGTHYYGKKNLETHSATCPHCNRAVNLSSYDTRLWFVVVFIPVIPLGRKRITDECSSCRKHFVADSDKWDQSRQLEISGSQEKFRANPTPENAITVHQQMVGFRQFAEAAAFRKDATEYFPENAKLQAYFGDALSYFGRQQEAEPYYQRAYTLRPDLPEARIGLAEAHIRAGRLDQARPLLDFLEKPGAAQLYSLGALENLALALQKNNRHEEALTLFKILQTELPTITDHPAFRKSVTRSEKALHRRESQLPKLPLGWKRFFGSSAQPQTRTLLIFGVLAACVILGLVIANENIRRNRTLHIVNGFTEPAKVSIAGIGEFTGLRNVQAITIPEGHYHATISGPVQQELDFDVTADYIDRWGDDRTWVINIGGAAVLVQEEATYGTNPPPSRYTIHFGNTFEDFYGVTHPFTPLPKSVQLKSSETKTLVDLQIHRGNGMDIFNYLVNQNNPARALDFAEAWLRFHPQEADLAGEYVSLAVQKKSNARADAYLRTRLKQRPVLIEWHRDYQSLHEAVAELPALTAEYDAALAGDPDNSALLYLRGRITAGRAGTRDYFNRSIKADARNPYPLYGLAADHLTLGEWTRARDLLAQAVTLQPEDQSFQQRLLAARLGAGEFALVEQEMRSRLKHDATDTPAAYRLIEALVLANKKAEAKKSYEAYATALRAQYGDKARDAINSMMFMFFYATADFLSLEKAAAKAGPIQSNFLFNAYVEQGKPAEAAKTLKLLGKTNPLHPLALAALWQQAGKTEECDKALDAARALFADGDVDAVSAAAQLNPAKLLDVAAILDLKIQPREKAMLLVALALRHPEHRDLLLPMARILNVQPVFPYHLIHRLTDAPL